MAKKTKKQVKSKRKEIGTGSETELQKRTPGRAAAEVIAKEPATKKEKIFTGIILGIGLLAIILIIVLSIPGHGEKKRIADKYGLPDDHVFTVIKFDGLKEKIESGDTFDLLMINSKQNECRQYIITLNYVRQERKDIPETIFLFDTYRFDTYRLKQEEKDFFEEIDMIKDLRKPSLTHWEPLEGKSKPIKKSTDMDPDKYHNLFYMLNDFLNYPPD